ncbi:MAG: ATP-binding cassette domain-containing protein [Bacteroidales bacterium]|nr:ATP-binding cassette domain-containing protein [Bacteroidales bacterium]
MTESILKALMRLFAIVTQIHPEDRVSQCRAIVELYLRQLVNPGKVSQYLIMYDFYHSSLREREIKTGEKQLSLFSVKAIIICEHINKVLDKKQKLLILMQLLEILNIKEIAVEEEIDFVRTIALAFKFDENVFQSCKSFILDSLFEVPQKESLLVIDSKNEAGFTGIKHVYMEYLKGKIIFLSVETANAYLFRNIDSDDRLYYKGQQVIPYRTYFLEKGATIKSPLVGTIYYSDVVKEFLSSREQAKINFVAEKVEFRFRNSNNGLHEFTMYEESGLLVGIMGGSGVGKSTLLNILNGNLTPRKGRVLVNGYDVHKDRDQIKGLIGFIPQDDLLIEELTVYQNLYFNAKFCFNRLSEDEIVKRVHKVLFDLDLYEIRNLTVGNPLNKFISGGQRKRLNIALELIREPFVLFVDEPTSGLSSSDSDNVIDLLKEQSLKGKLVISNIHQPSSDIYKLFDKLIVMDKGGRIVFHGNPLDALVYFKTENQLINADDGECPTCGNVNPEQLLQILESKKVSEYGEYISERQVSEEEWYLQYKKNIEPEVNPGAEIKSDLPSNDFEIPGKLMQFKIFSIRNLLSKLSDKQYLLINLLEAPLLAFILGWFTKYNAGTYSQPGKYIFSDNVNLPVYIFMSVIVALFLGLMVSAEEIIRDRKLLKRESFLNLSRGSYYNSKIIFLIGLSAVQTVVFVWVGNSILQIKGMFLYYWFMLFITAVFANFVGLNISSALKSVVAIYILIPLLLVPQILLGGAMIRFDKLNSKLTNPQYVPVVGDIMTSRWAYEGLAVNQFKRNKYQHYFLETDMQISDAAFKLNYLIPELILTLNNIERNIKLNKDQQSTINDFALLRNEITKLGDQLKGSDVGFIKQLNITSYNLSSSNKTRKFLNQAKSSYRKSLDESIDKKDKLILDLKKDLGGADQLIEFKQKYQNNSLEEILLNKRETNKFEINNKILIRKDEPVYKTPENNFGRAHFFSSEKLFFGNYIDTYWFNSLIIVIMAIAFYILLLTELFSRIAIFLETYTIKSVYMNFRTYLNELLKPILKSA